ncbi:MULTISPECIES: hypothetical protein [Actinoalloteichus]|uniref:Uncharacterized protein n=1 Tax=Actinoalloteichus fjordicus TaxID=1612552 RepID=A0AAC9LIX1_9PSEU|nr:MULTISPECIES: hypothetical protein [Actinoalloteichus]APU17604.1 hypothetical protein UA74_28015 [Actinoalloteichus fjordicus]APU23680.1 hypothetical protein UA75_28545 [Actinoalloteichus sp. GBA129-24]
MRERGSVEGRAARLRAEFDSRLRSLRENREYYRDKSAQMNKDAAEATKKTTDRWGKRISALQRWAKEKEKRQADPFGRQHTEQTLNVDYDADEMRDASAEIDEMERVIEAEAAGAGYQGVQSGPLSEPTPLRAEPPHQPPPVARPAPESFRASARRRAEDDDDDYSTGNWLQ